MRALLVICQILGLLTVATWSPVVVAIDSTGLSGRFGLVGVISDDAVNGKHKTLGVAVLKDKQNGVTMTLKTGQNIPNEANLKITSVRRNVVTISDGNNVVDVTYMGSSFEESSESEKPIAGRMVDLSDMLDKTSVLDGFERGSVDNERLDSDSKPRFVTPGWIENNSARTSEYLPLEELEEENFSFE